MATCPSAMSAEMMWAAVRALGMYLMTRWFPAPSPHPPCSLAQLRPVHGTREGHRRHGRAGWNVLPGASHPHHSRATQPRVQAPVEWYVQHNSCGRVRVCADVVGAVASTKPDDDGGKKGYKAKKEDERKATAMKDANVWHSLFIRSDTAVQALAEKFGLKQVCYRHPLHLPPRRTSPTLLLGRLRTAGRHHGQERQQPRCSCRARGDARYQGDQGLLGIGAIVDVARRVVCIRRLTVAARVLLAPLRRRA